MRVVGAHHDADENAVLERVGVPSKGVADGVGLRFFFVSVGAAGGGAKGPSSL